MCYFETVPHRLDDSFDKSTIIVAILCCFYPGQSNHYGRQLLVNATYSFVAVVLRLDSYAQQGMRQSMQG